MIITPLSDRVLVRVDDNDTRTVSGLHLPDTVRHNVTTGTVVAVGPGRVGEDGQRVPMDRSIRNGARVQFVKYGGATLEAYMDDHLMLREEEIVGVIS